ncbi:polyadenylate-binding protein-interacting protein 1 [Frankliniella occidentalis]|uniref:Polyadenylate-binding protein-interacting protein 1 n=1 Tax=Frankliniella occidentalis TaxID=133901 RepID=A0A6J1T060_FRAOC|nr:polyadenylate-binding protein-interacting protein 1 [Frankliniella occidentalis]XP_026284106.1 polyadenylate-binding protein-interacting protein 1 [Frankliniella occidentalis]XP_026284107.1 polyadenylate-binding protein-interacting protein 1 [Frankliniella occidentalis]
MNPSNGAVKAVGRGRGPWRPDQEVHELRRPQMPSVQSESSSSSTTLKDETLDPLAVAFQSKLSVNAKEFVPKGFTCTLPANTQALSPYESEKDEQQSVYEEDSDVSFEEWLYQYVTDVIRNITLNPGQFDPLSRALMDELRPIFGEEEAVESIVSLIIDQAIKEPNFRYSGARLCNLINKYSSSKQSSMFRRILLTKLNGEHEKIEDNMENNPDKVYGFLYFLGELYIQLELHKGVRITILGDGLILALKILIQIPQIENIKHSCAVLKLTGYMLDCDQREVMNELFVEFDKLLLDERAGTRAKDIVSNLLKLRSNNWGHVPSSVIPPKQSRHVDAEPTWNADGIYYGPDHLALTAEEYKFLDDSCGKEETVSSSDDATVWDPEANENENAEIAAAFQEFVNQKHKP